MQEMMKSFGTNVTTFNRNAVKLKNERPLYENIYLPLGPPNIFVAHSELNGPFS